MLLRFLCFSVILDEVDILYNDEDFELALQSLVNSAPITAQYLFVTATLPVEIYNKLVQLFPDCEVLMGPSIHRTSPRLEEVQTICIYFQLLMRKDLSLMIVCSDSVPSSDIVLDSSCKGLSKI